MPEAAIPATSATPAGYAAPTAAGLLVFRAYGWYALTSANPMVLLIPSRKEAVLSHVRWVIG